MSSAPSPQARSAVSPVVTALVDARRQDRRQPSAAFAHLVTTAEQAYEVQSAVARELNWFGNDAPRYWKSGGSGRDAALTHAPLPPAGVWQSPASVGSYPVHCKGIEAEIAVRLGKAVSPALAATIDEAGVAALVEAMAVSIELIDYRWQECGAAPALLRLADLQSHGALVLGDWQPWSVRDWAQQACRVEIGARPPALRRGAHPLGTPTWGLPGWLRHVTRNGDTVAAGTVVTTGSWVGILEAQAGDRVVVTYEGVGSAQVQL